MILDKPSIRKEVRQKRRGLSSSEKNIAEKKLLRSLRQSQTFQAAQHVAIYHTHDGEISTELLVKDLLKRKKTLYLPVLHPFKKGHLGFVRFDKNTRMIKNRFGILEPVFRLENSINPAFLNWVCMPLVAFDAQGNRLGMGGGFYDRTFSFVRHREVKPKLIGLAYELQKYPKLPTETWDIPLAAIATDKKLYAFS
ncbi:MAG: hypothetical protein RL217_1328 [Pseudomonadota bacterium]|jgi:5-formyltetrahydrofolate cyclo-ligase